MTDDTTDAPVTMDGFDDALAVAARRLETMVAKPMDFMDVERIFHAMRHAMAAGLDGELLDVLYAMAARWPEFGRRGAETMLRAAEDGERVLGSGAVSAKVRA